MPYLIDGHNLIPQMPGLSLEDPHDEAKLVLAVRQFCLRERRKATIIFDGGLPGGKSSLSTSTVSVIFASDRHTTADDLLLNRIRDERDPSGLILVTSDQRVANAARHRRITVKPSAEFARLMQKTNQKTKPAAEKKEGLQAGEVAEWEALFSKKTHPRQNKPGKP